MGRSSIAVVGAGITGLATSWFIRNHFSVTLFERESVLGGHAHSLEVRDPEGSVWIDTGFVVFNHRNYPLLTQLFSVLNVPTQNTDMSFSYSMQPDGIEYAGNSLNTLFAQRRNLFRPRFLRMVADIIRFNRLAKHYLAQPEPDASCTLEHFLLEHRLGRGFCEDYLLPMGAAIWSCPLSTMLEFPAKSFLQFFKNHGLLDLVERPQWKTVTGGSRQYVERIRQDLSNHSTQHSAVEKIRRVGSRWELAFNQQTALFDHVVLACHADEALRLLVDPAPDLKETLGAFRFQSNQAILHTDTRLLPRSPRVWSSWNYLAQNQSPSSRDISVSYFMNQLHRFNLRTNYIVSLNPWLQPHPTMVIHEVQWQHPVFDLPALRAQRHLEQIQGRDNLYLAGAWTGYGFHEDGIRSALRVANALGIPSPW